MFKTLAVSTHEKYNTPTGVTLHSKYFSLCHPSMLSSLHYPALTLVSLFLVYFGNNYKSKFHKTVRISRHCSTEEGPQPTLSVPRLLPGGGHGHSCLAWPLLPWALLIPLWVNPALSGKLPEIQPCSRRGLSSTSSLQIFSKLPMRMTEQPLGGGKTHHKLQSYSHINYTMYICSYTPRIFDSFLP